MRAPTSRGRIARERLPDRRPNETFDLQFDGVPYAVTIGYFSDGRPGEVFSHGAKVGSNLDALLNDACVALSILLQSGVEPGQLSHSMGSLGGSRGRASVIGVLADLLAATPIAVARNGSFKSAAMRPAGW